MCFVRISTAQCTQDVGEGTNHHVDISCLNKHMTKQSHDIPSETIFEPDGQNHVTNFDEPEYCLSPVSSPLTKTKAKCKSVILTSSEVFRQLCDIGYMSESPGARNLSNTMVSDYYEVDSELIDSIESFSSRFVYFVQQTIQRYLVNASTVLNNCHERCLNMFIVSAFDMARDMMITPKKLEFAREKETELYKTLMKISVEKGDEIKLMISETIQSIQQSLVEKAAAYEFLGKFK